MQVSSFFFVYLHNKDSICNVMCYEVTIGIPVYRAIDFIGKTMESVLVQTFDSIEYLVIDDCGDDGTIHIVEQYKEEHPRGKDIRILYNDRNYGVGFTRNRLLEEASGKYMYFMDSDDIIEPHTIMLMVEQMRKYQVDVVYASMDRRDKVNNTEVKAMILPDAHLFSEGEMAYYAFRNYNSFQISVCNCLMDLSFLRDNNLHFIDSSFWEDMAFTYEMVMQVKRAVLLSDITYHYICRPNTLSHYQKREQMDKNEILANVATINYLKEKAKYVNNNHYLPYLCKNLEMNSFYIICYIIKNKSSIKPGFSNVEIRHIMRHPFGLHSICRFQNMIIVNLFLWFIGKLPVPIFIPLVRFLGHLKSVI